MILLANRCNGPDQDSCEERHSTGSMTYAVIRPDELAAIAEQYKMVAGFDKDALNERVSLDPPV